MNERRSSYRHLRARLEKRRPQDREWPERSADAAPRSDGDNAVRVVGELLDAKGERDMLARLRRDACLWRYDEPIDLTSRLVGAMPPQRPASDLFSPLFSWQNYAAIPQLVAWCPHIVFFDLETTGLSAIDLLFQAGYAHFAWREPTAAGAAPWLDIVQEVATDVADERELVERARSRIAARPIVVTFNGRSFDVPALRRRLRFHGLSTLRDDVFVVDLLHLARRRHKDDVAARLLPNLKLGTLESQVLKKERQGHDVPGFEVPLRFRDYRESGSPRHLLPVLYHNRIDLTTMVALLPLMFESMSVAERDRVANVVGREER